MPEDAASIVDNQGTTTIANNKQETMCFGNTLSHKSQESAESGLEPRTVAKALTGMHTVTAPHGAGNEQSPAAAMCKHIGFIAH